MPHSMLPVGLYRTDYRAILGLTCLHSPLPRRFPLPAIPCLRLAYYSTAIHAPPAHPGSFTLHFRVARTGILRIRFCVYVPSRAHLNSRRRTIACTPVLVLVSRGGARFRTAHFPACYYAPHRIVRAHISSSTVSLPSYAMYILGRCSARAIAHSPHLI